MAYEINGESIEHDEEGYLSDINQWTPELAELLAKDEGIEMSDEHWEVINFLREYYEEYPLGLKRIQPLRISLECILDYQILFLP